VEIRSGKERKKEPKKERKLRKGRLVESAAAEEIVKGRLRRYLFDDFHKLLGSPAGLPHLPQARRLNLINQNGNSHCR
jgi:hypothetical protein